MLLAEIQELGFLAILGVALGMWAVMRWK